MTYLHIRGTLAESMVYVPRPGHESARRERGSAGDPAFQLVLLDQAGRLLLSVAPRVVPRGCGSANDPMSYGVRGSLPLHPDAAAYELRRGEIRLYGAVVTSEPPRIAAPGCYPSPEGPTLRWEAGQVPASASTYGNFERPLQGLTYSVVAVMESGRRITVARGLTELTHTVDLSRMPTHGKGTLYLVANDGVRSAEVEAGAIDVPARPPTVHILMPAAGAYLPLGHPVCTLGCCLDMGGQPCSPDGAVWLLDGERVAAGRVVAAIEGVTAGTHRLTLAYEENGIRLAESSISLVMEEADEAYYQWEALLAPERPVIAPPEAC